MCLNALKGQLIASVIKGSTVCWICCVLNRLIDTSLKELANVGIGVHHAGLVMDDRKATEQLYLKGTLRVLIATSVCIQVLFCYF
jgi:superfamily II DNA helicase RecQ